MKLRTVWWTLPTRVEGRTTALPSWWTSRKQVASPAERPFVRSSCETRRAICEKQVMPVGHDVCGMVMVVARCSATIMGMSARLERQMYHHDSSLPADPKGDGNAVSYTHLTLPTN